MRPEREVTALGDLGLRVEIAGVRDRAGLRERLASLPFVHDALVTETHAAVYGDALPADAAGCVRALVDAHAEVARDANEHERRGAEPLVISVRFAGPDLAEVARGVACTEEELIARFLAPLYEVAFVGFLPGFGYLRGIDPSLATIGRRAAPRARVEAGSVAIAAGYAGIYPGACAGGWNLLGVAEGFAPFTEDGRAALATGTRVRFARASRGRA